MIPFCARAIYSAGIAIRNKRIFRNLEFLKSSEQWSLPELHQYQLTKLQELLHVAATGSLFYQRLFRDNRVDISKVTTLSDVRQLPITSKATVLENAATIQTSNSDEKLFLSESSGSTGQPLVFYRNKDWDAWVNASVFRGYSWHGVQPWERNGYLWGYNISPKQRRKTRALDYLQNRFRLFSYDRNEMLEFIHRLKSASYLNGYSSMIYELAKLANEEGLDLSHLKLVKGTSEKIQDAYQVEALKAFKKRIVSEYGSAEGGIIAFECPYGRMHINMETVIVEEQDGEIVLTNLVSRSFPIIRYKLGDYIKVNRNIRCECGMQHEVLEEVTGRVGDRIRGRSRDFPSLTLYYVFKNLALQRGLQVSYTSFQNKIGVLDVDIDMALGANDMSALQAEFSKYFGSDVVVNIASNHERDDFRSKKKDFVSRLA